MRYSSSSDQSGESARCSSRELGRSLPNGFSTYVAAISRTIAEPWDGRTYDDSRDPVLGVAVALQVLGDCDEDTWGKCHVEYPVGLLATILDLCHVLFELEEGLVLVVLARNVCAETTELVQLLFNLLCGGLDVRLNSLKVLFMVHLCSRITDNSNILGQEVVSVLFVLSMEAG